MSDREIKAAEAMREAAAKLCEQEAKLRKKRLESNDPQWGDPISQAHKLVTASGLARAIRALPLPDATPEPSEQCQRCQGNGEIVIDQERYLHPRAGDKGDEAVAECPDCDGEGTIDAGKPVVESQPSYDELFTALADCVQNLTAARADNARLRQEMRRVIAEREIARKALETIAADREVDRGGHTEIENLNNASEIAEAALDAMKGRA